MSKKKKAPKAREKSNVEEWRKKPVHSKWALKNLPKTKDPVELKKRERMKKWEELNQRLVDSWLDYLSATNMTDEKENIVTKREPGLLSKGYVYDAETLEPIMSKKNPGEVMEYEEWTREWEYARRIKRATEGGMKGFFQNLFDGLWWGMGS